MEERPRARLTRLGTRDKMIHTIRPGFTITQGLVTYVGGEEVDLTAAEFELHKHKLEGVESSVIPIDTDGNNKVECCFPQPFISKITPFKLVLASTQTINVEGSFFTPDTTVNIESARVNNVEFISSHLLKVSLTVGDRAGLFDLTINNGDETIASQAIELFDVGDAIVDLRIGGAVFGNNAIAMRAGMSFTRTATGVQFNGSNPWSSWARFVGDTGEWVWSRREKVKLSWIFTNSSSMMVGIGSFETNETSTSQWREGEIMGYCSSATNFYGFYGNDGTPGTLANQSTGGSFTSGSTLKLVLENNGEPRSNFYLYQLPSANIEDWMDTSNLIVSGTIANSMNADAATIMPFCIPRSGSATTFLGFIQE